MAQPDHNSEKRKHPRVNFPCDFTLWPEGDVEEVIMGNAANISAGGMSAFMYKSFFEGEIGKVTIGSPHLTEPLHMRYKAIRSEQDFATSGEWKNYYKVSIQFTELEDEKQIALATLVERLIEAEQKKNSSSR